MFFLQNGVVLLPFSGYQLDLKKENKSKSENIFAGQYGYVCMYKLDKNLHIITKNTCMLYTCVKTHIMKTIHKRI